MFLKMWIIGLILVFGLTSKLSSEKPNRPIPKQKLLQYTGELKEVGLSKPTRILWLYGPEDHRGGEHDYIRIKELFVPLLMGIKNVSVDTAYQFPSKEQFDQADLLIQYLHLPQLNENQFVLLENFVKRGGAVLSLHESCIIRPTALAERLADCLGCAWHSNDDSKWRTFNRDQPLVLNTDHDIFKGLPAVMRFNDESYWQLLQRKEVEVLAGVAAATGKDELKFKEIMKVQTTRSQAFWLYAKGKGRVIGTTTGHFTSIYYDPMYRLLLFRSMAWLLNESPAAFMPLVYAGITNQNGLVGTTNSMMNYSNRQR